MLMANGKPFVRWNISLASSGRCTAGCFVHWARICNDSLSVNPSLMRTLAFAPPTIFVIAASRVVTMIRQRMSKNLTPLESHKSSRTSKERGCWCAKSILSLSFASSVFLGGCLLWSGSSLTQRFCISIRSFDWSTGPIRIQCTPPGKHSFKSAALLRASEANTVLPQPAIPCRMTQPSFSCRDLKAEWILWTSFPLWAKTVGRCGTPPSRRIFSTTQRKEK